MVCVYCGSPTRVINSRHQRRTNDIWRRRKCLNCLNIFTSNEQAELATAIIMESGDNLLPFNRDTLFVSILESCKHRPTAISDANSLTSVIITRLLKGQKKPGLTT